MQPFLYYVHTLTKRNNTMSKQELGKLGTPGNTLVSVKWDAKHELLDLEVNGLAVGSLALPTARKFAKSDHKWNVAVSMYNYHELNGLIKSK